MVRMAETCLHDLDLLFKLRVQLDVVKRRDFPIKHLDRVLNRIDRASRERRVREIAEIARRRLVEIAPLIVAHPQLHERRKRPRLTLWRRRVAKHKPTCVLRRSRWGKRGAHGRFRGYRREGEAGGHLSLGQG